MKNELIIKIVSVVVFLVLSVGVIIYANTDRPKYTITESSGVEYETARVLSVLEDNTTIDADVENVKKGSAELEVEILTGRYKGDVCKVTNYFSALYNVDVSKGDTVSVRIDTSDVNEYTISIYNYNRIPLTIGLVVVFFGVLLLLGGKQGLKAFIGLVYTVVAIIFVLLPLTLKGVSPIPLTIGIVFVTSAVCFLLIGGIQKKTIAAALGSLAGVLIAAFLGAIAAKVGGVTTFQMDEAEALLLVKSTNPIQLRGLFISGILIAAMGAVMDIAMSISSAISEVHEANSKLGFKDLFAAGMNIGRDAMGTMANTLVLAYVGGALNMMVLIYSYGVSFTQLINTDFVAIELIRAIAGSVGIIGTVPCVAAISASLMSREK
ncbi:YibE/F family protein [Pseudobutyrivibrio xylanivorans]|uniref:YibE/F family protein n=1 Tax=Pseudobutyrivibrio xylanivorans TaxID=185007 RepID=A0A5P6VPV3_PSEXY|nr:YibE/F family protein [Pseudobutyrivibrio xylanivorans]QFJ54490.1 YibE/F family protein [Pseudobutyrivibrio xylanivorans]